MQIGPLDFIPAYERLDLVAKPVIKAFTTRNKGNVYVSAIDPTLSDTAAFCSAYGVEMGRSANCVILEAKRADRTWYVACLILAADRTDVNGIVRRHLEARKLSFASMEEAVSLTGMEFGGITPIGLPRDWPILVDRKIIDMEWVIIGSGIRSSKLLIPGSYVAQLPNTEVLDIAKAPSV
jgi:prolyl-tRNA editing enzyme YbaK/EbsC (Cys-tRNA(Pro) deacylase)